MTTLSRRETLLAPVALAATSAVTTAAAEKKMTLAMHQNTSNGAGYRKSLEGWARAEIKDVEITNILLDEFLKTDSLGIGPPGYHRPGPEPRPRCDWRDRTF